MNIFTDDVKSPYEPIYEENLPINGYSAYIRPQSDEKAVEKGNRCVKEVNDKFIADFEKNEAYCKVHGGEPDLMCHVSTFYKINGKIYVTYYASETCAAEDPINQEARIAFCDDPEISGKKENPTTVLTVQKAGDKLGDDVIVKVYDTVSAYVGGDIIYILWTASTEKNYYRFTREYNIKTGEFGESRVNKIKVGEVVNDFSTTGIKSALAANKIPQKRTFEDIGIMQKFNPRVENGETYYYTGAYSGYLTFIIKTRDFITWEYVAEPDFDNFSLWENSTFVIGDDAYYFVRQEDCKQGFLTKYSLKDGSWEKPVLISDCSSRGDFFLHKGTLYLVNAPKNREGFAVIKVDTDDISKSYSVLCADMKTSLFYPFTQVVGDDVYISYTVDRKHIRLSKFRLTDYL